jgi:hypothetical protein
MSFSATGDGARATAIGDDGLAATAFRVLSVELKTLVTHYFLIQLNTRNSALNTRSLPLAFSF